jgi:hypothetical protein
MEVSIVERSYCSNTGCTQPDHFSEQKEGYGLECPYCEFGFCPNCFGIIENNPNHVICPNRECNAVLELPQALTTRTVAELLPPTEGV